MKQRFLIEGMSCANCALGIEKTLYKTKGIKEVNVSLIRKEMAVVFNVSQITENEIVNIVNKLGYVAKVFKDGEDLNGRYLKVLKNRFIISLSLLIPLMYLCLSSSLNLPNFKNESINFLLQIILSLTIIIINKKFFISGFKAVKNKSANMDTLVSLGSISAFVYSLIMVLLFFISNKKTEHLFFDSSAMVLTLVTLGKLIEEKSKIKTGNAVEKLKKLIPKTATILKDGKEQTVNVDDIQIGDIVVLKSGDYLSVDGTIIDGSGNVDKSAINGESMPVEVSKGYTINSGSMLKDGYLLIQVNKIGEETLFSKIISAVKKAEVSKAPIQKLADKISSFFVPIVVLIALIVFIIWLIISNDLYKAFNFGISVLVISCPCALGLATPVAIVQGVGLGASNGILFKNAEAIQNASKINLIVLDKTATLTNGTPIVTDFVLFGSYEKQYVFKIASALEEKSKHPLSFCIKNYCGSSNLVVSDYKYVIGKGIIGFIDDKKYYLGNYDLLPKNYSVTLDDNLEGKTLIYLANDSEVICVFGVFDSLKKGSYEAVSELTHKGIKCVMLTGDNNSIAKKTSQQLGGIDFKAEVLPHEKLSFVESYKNSGYYVCMVGDGINDSPALKGSDVGIAVANGTDIAIDSADVILINKNLQSLTKMVEISRKTNKVIKQNLFWAFFYNLIAIPISGGLFSKLGIYLTPQIASICMCLSSLMVVTNAFRIKIDKNKKRRVNGMIIKVEGMMCKHCEKKVFDVVSSLESVKEVQVNLKKKTVTVNDDASFEEIKTAILDAGYQVKE